MTFRSNPFNKSVAILVGLGILFGLYLTSLYSYLLFHSLVETFTIVVAFAIFMLAWNARSFLDNNYLLFIGISYLFVALVTILHMLAYKGMGVFPNSGANLPTQLWIAGQYLYSLSFVIAALFINRSLKIPFVFLGYALVTGLLLGSIFYGRVFPDAYVEGSGLTPFKKISEVIISLLYLVGIGLLFQHRHAFDPNIWRLLVLSLVVSIGAELIFTLYISVYSSVNLLGHYLRLIAFYLVYKAIIETGMVQPHNLLFRNLKQSEETLRQYTTELQARNEDLNAFARTVAHDLKSPLANIIGTSSVLLEYYPTLSNKERQDSLQAMMRTAFKMNDIINELLLLAEVRQAEVPVDRLDMGPIVAAVEERLSHTLKENRGQLIQPATWPPALGYGPWVEEVWANYISNALKYGGQPPCVELGATPQPNGMVRFWVQDNGPGLAPEDQARLFTPFTRLHPTGEEGHGLGLAIVRRIVEKLNGQVGVESAGIPGQGSLFFFTLPAAPR